MMGSTATAYPYVDLNDLTEQNAWADRCRTVLDMMRGIDDLPHFNSRLNLIQARISNPAQYDEYPQAVGNLQFEVTPCHGKYVAAVFADGGVSYVNPSPYGGAWAFCHVDQHEHRVREGRGVFAPWEPEQRYMPYLGSVGRDKRSTQQPCISNNQMEFYALLVALETLPDGWSGFAYSDSQITLGRFFYNWNPYKGVPVEWVGRMRDVTKRLGKVTPVLLSGHPTRRDLAELVKRSTGRMVSLHNVWCDEECSRLTAVMPPDVVRRARYPQEA